MHPCRLYRALVWQYTGYIGCWSGCIHAVACTRPWSGCIRAVQDAGLAVYRLRADAPIQAVQGAGLAIYRLHG